MEEERISHRDSDKKSRIKLVEKLGEMNQST
jgi:hypothetical protein